jgi:hypothetical protein
MERGLNRIPKYIQGSYYKKKLYYVVVICTRLISTLMLLNLIRLMIQFKTRIID